MKRFVIIGIIAAICIFAIIISINNNDYNEYFDTDCDLTLKIISGGDVRDDGTFYISKAIKINNKDVSYKTNIRIKILSDNKGYKYGDIIAAKAMIQKSDEARNPGNFDYRKYLLSINVSATVMIKNIDQITFLGNKPDNILVWAGISLNEKICGNLRRLLPGKESKIIEAVLLGNKEYISRDMADDFSNAGISHYLSVSGAQVIFFIIPFSYVLKKLKTRKQLRYIIEILLIILYVSVAGFGLPAVRASIIIIMNKGAFLLKRDRDKITSIFIALLILVINNPLIIYSTGAWLSFTCAFSIVFLNPKVNKKLKSSKVFNFLPNKILNMLSLCITVQIGILPIMINNFSMPSLLVLLSNIIAAPIIELIMIIGTITVIISFTGPLFIAQLIAYVLYLPGEIIVFIAGTVSGLSSVKLFDVTYMTAFCVAVYYILLCGLAFFKFKNKMIKNTVIILIITAVLINNFNFPSNILEIVFMDVGQGDGAFLRSPDGKTCLIDCGSGNINNVSENRIVPFLKHERIKKLDFIAVSHTDNDHISGIYYLLSGFEVEYLIMPDIPSLKDEIYNKIVETAKANNVKIIFFKKGDSIKDGNMVLKCLHPYKGLDLQDNNSLSMVLEVDYGNFKGLFTGDLPAEEEKELCEENEFDKINLLKAAHHGSDHSSSDIFMEKVKPDIAVISCAKYNNYGHPGKNTLKRIGKYTDKIYITSNCGAVTVKTDGNGINVSGFIK